MMKPLIIKTFFVLLVIHCLSSYATDFSKVFKKVDPAVVVIFTQQEMKHSRSNKLHVQHQNGLGSGVLISAEGLILTAAHVVNNADKLTVQLLSGKTYKATILSSIVIADLALIKIDSPPKNLAFIEPSDSDNIDIGEEILVIGAPYGLAHTLTVGHLSGRRLQSDNKLIALELLQTDAAVNQGNSGGPVLDKKGRLIGIISHIASQSGGNEGLGFAVSINMAKRVILNEPPIWFGLDFLPLSNTLAQALNVPRQNGALVQGVAAGSFAEKLGLKGGHIPVIIEGHKTLLGGDIIFEMGGNTIYYTPKGRERIFDYIRSVPVGEKISVTVLRNGKVVTLSAVKPAVEY